MHENISGIGGKLKKDSKFKSQTCANEQTEKVENCPGKELNGQCLEIVGNFCYLAGIMGTRGGAFDSVMQSPEVKDVNSEI